jgi:hypothetical protein
MSPPVADLNSKRVQAYTDGQLYWIVQNGIRFTGMPASHGILDENETWLVVRYLRHLPAKGSAGVLKVYREAEEEHEHVEQQHGGNERATPSHNQTHDHH